MVCSQVGSYVICKCILHFFDRVERKLEYFATLCSHFNDGAVLMRPIRGVYMSVSHQHLRPIYGEPILLNPTAKVMSAPPILVTLNQV